MQRWMTTWWCQSTKGSTPGTKPNHVFPGDFLAKHIDSCLCFYPYPICKSLKVSNYFCFLPGALWKGKIPTLSDPCKTPSVIKHHTANEKYPILKCLSYDIQSNFSKRVKAKTQMKLPADKGGGIITDSVLLTLLTPLRSHTDFAQRFPHPHVEVSPVSLPPFLHHNWLLPD